MSIVKELQNARYLISDPAKWTQGAFGRDSFKVPRHSRGKETVCWCSLGALVKANEKHRIGLSETESFLNDVSVDVHGVDIIDFNDYSKRTHEEVLMLFDIAIERAKSKENEE